MYNIACYIQHISDTLRTILSSSDACTFALNMHVMRLLDDLNERMTQLRVSIWRVSMRITSQFLVDYRRYCSFCGRLLSILKSYNWTHLRRSQHDGVLTPLAGDDNAATHQLLLLLAPPTCSVETTE